VQQVTRRLCAILIVLRQLQRAAAVVFLAANYAPNFALRMELFLNLFWLSLLVPAFLLWRQRTSSDVSRRPVVLVCVLGCVLLLLFPVISATDDLHPMRPEMKESERAFRQASNNTRTLHVSARAAHPILPGSVSVTIAFEQLASVIPLLPRTLRTFAASARSGRAPPSAHPIPV
jgi:hypothetical protein